MSRPAFAAPTNVPISGEIESLILTDPTNTTTDPYARGRIVVGGQSIILPRNLLIDLPANRLSLWQIFDQAPAECKARQESGLAKTDVCNTSGMGGIATITAVRTNAGNVIAGDVFIEKAVEAVTGTITFIDYTNGLFRVNGTVGDPITGTIVRLNDPTSRHTIQQGPGCAPGSAAVNCSADPRFGLDPDNYVITFSTGYPACIPSMVSRLTQTPLPAASGIPAIPAGTTAQAAADGTGDIMCPSTNRTPGVLLEPAVADSRRFAPIMLGDSITAEGNFENIGGVRFLSAHTMSIHKALATRNVPDQPDYLFLEEVFIAVAGFENQRAIALWIGFTTLAPTDVDIWSIHRDPVNNDIHELPLASTRGCDLAAGTGTCASQGLVNAGANIFRVRYDVDFLAAATGNPPGGADTRLSPCAHLNAAQQLGRFSQNTQICPGGGTFAENFAVMSPVPHEIQARTGHAQLNPGLVTVDINGAEATNGQYLFPLGFNLGGIEAAEFAEIDLNQISKPTIFEGIPWNLDRRLGPSGCLGDNGVPVLPCPAGPVGTLSFALDPFPFSGLDPRTQADFVVPAVPPALPITGGLPKGPYNVTALNDATLTNVRDRIFSHVDPVSGIFSGDSTILSCATGTFPANCPLDPPLSLADILIRPAVGLGLSLNVTSPTRATTQTISGTIQAGLTPVVSVSTAATVGAVSLSPDGTAWSAQISNMPAGTNVVTVNAADPAGNTDRAAAGINVIFPDGSFSGKGPVSVADALKALRMSIGLVTPTAEDMLHGDVHPQGAPDGVVGLNDALLILRKAIGLVSF